tara:strand:+ start:124 stop:582 length:459 start_codon:yes stop_codon:yes gene_type:complete
MAFSTFTGPVRSGTVKNTTGTTLGTIDNTGVVVLVQTASLALATSVVAVLPAGSQILDILIDVTTTFTTSSTLAVGDGTTVDAYVTAITTATAGRQAITFSGAQLTAMSNIGTSDVAVTVTMAGTTAIVGAGLITIRYAQRTSAGSEVPASA